MFHATPDSVSRHLQSTSHPGENIAREIWRRDEPSPKNSNVFCQGRFELSHQILHQESKASEEVPTADQSPSVELTNRGAVSTGSHLQLPQKRRRCAGQGLNDIPLLWHRKMKWGS